MHPNHHPIIPSSRYETEVALASRSLRAEKKRDTWFDRLLSFVLCRVRVETENGES